MTITVLDSLVERVEFFQGFLGIIQSIKKAEMAQGLAPLPLYRQNINFNILTGFSLSSQVLHFLQQGIPGSI